MTHPTKFERAVAMAIARAEWPTDPDSWDRSAEKYAERMWVAYLGGARAAIAEVFRWRPIEEAPKEFKPALCMRAGWNEPCLLYWKHNHRLDPPSGSVLTEEEEAWLARHAADYFGDPNEMDDYELATEEGRPTHYLPLEHLSPSPEDKP